MPVCRACAGRRSAAGAVEFADEAKELIRFGGVEHAEQLAFGFLLNPRPLFMGAAAGRGDHSRGASVGRSGPARA